MKKISDEQLEELLRNMPKLNDHRDPHEIYENISKRLEKRPRKTWVIPSFATAATALLIAILSINMLGEEKINHSADKSMKEEATTEQETSLRKEDSVAEDKASLDTGKQENSTEMNDFTFQATEEPTTAIYDEDMGAMQVFTLAIPDNESQNMIPVSFLIEPVDEAEKLAQIEDVMATIDEEQMGLDNYYPLQADLSIDEAVHALQVDVEADHMYQNGTSGEPFQDVINQLLVGLNLDKAVFTTNKTENGMSTGHDMIYDITKDEQRNLSFFLFYPTDITKPYIVPFTESYTTIQEALNEMKTNVETHDLIAPLLVDQIELVTPDETNKLLTITFNKDVQIEDTPETVQSIEAILLTAKSFGYEKVKFTNAPIDQVGRFQLLEEIKVPVAANKKSIN
jgi:hypothetical protein